MADPEAPRAPFAGVRISDPKALEQRLGQGPAGPGGAAESFWFDAPLDPVLDPFSSGYRRAVLAAWRLVAGRARDWRPPLLAEPPAGGSGGTPWPYAVGDAARLGEAWQGLGFMLAASEARAGHRVLCLGLSDGNIALDLARLGCAVSAIDPDGGAVARLRDLGRRLGVAMRLHQAPLSQAAELAGTRRFDRIVTHRALQADPEHGVLLQMLRARLLAAGGRLLIGGELLLETMPMPWGLDPTEESLRAMRAGLPIRLMFRPSYLLEALTLAGWQARLSACPQTALGNVMLAEPRRDVPD